MLHPERQRTFSRPQLPVGKLAGVGTYSRYGACKINAPRSRKFWLVDFEEGSVSTILLVVLILLLLGVLPTWPHSRNWGYGPSGLFGVLLVVLLVLLLTGRL